MQSEHKSLRPGLKHGRAVNVVAELLRRTLRVPNIYLDAQMPKLNRRRFDIMAANDAGGGDIHVVSIRLGDSKDWKRILDAMKETSPAHFMYLASDLPEISRLASNSSLFAVNGIGRVGLIELSGLEDEEPNAKVLLRPERFRVAPQGAMALNAYLHKHQPDIEVRI